jgi:hypothetical protein
MERRMARWHVPILMLAAACGSGQRGAEPTAQPPATAAPASGARADAPMGTEPCPLMSLVGKDVRAMFGTVSLSFGDIISKVAHDQDNDQGLWVVNDTGQTWKAYGDGHMYKRDPDNRTAEMTRLAVSLGVDDIRTAETLGAIDAGQAGRPPSVLFADVMSHAKSPAVPGNKFAPEQIIPRPDPSRVADNGTQNWTASSFSDLWGLLIRTDQRETYGDLITAALRPNGAFFDMLASKADQVTEREKGFYPRRAYLEFLGRLQRDPKFWMYAILAGAS